MDFSLATRQRRLPCVLTPGQVQAILQQLCGRDYLIIALLYGSGLRVSECLRLRIQDIDLDRMALTVRDSKGNKDRQTLLSAALRESLQAIMADALALQKKTMPRGLALPYPACSVESTLMRFANLRGCLFFRLQPSAVIRLQVYCAVIICMILWYASFYARRLWQLVLLTSALTATLFAILLRLICCNQAMIFAPCRSCWATMMSKPRRSTLMCWAGITLAPTARWMP